MLEKNKYEKLRSPWDHLTENLNSILILYLQNMGLGCFFHPLAFYKQVLGKTSVYS